MKKRILKEYSGMKRRKPKKKKGMFDAFTAGVGKLDGGEDTGKKKKTRRQVAFLLSEGSPLTDAQKRRLREEMESGEVMVEG